MVAPSGGHFGFGGRRTFLDLGAVLAGGLPLPGARNSCQDQAGQLEKTPSILVFPTPNHLKVVGLKAFLLTSKVWMVLVELALPSSWIIFTHLLSSLSPWQLSLTTYDVIQFNHCFLEIPRHGTSTLILLKAATLKDQKRPGIMRLTDPPSRIWECV